MQLTKEQIQKIENRLKKAGVNYWDIRIEMLDHIVTDIEHQLDNGEDFNKAVQNAMLKLGWKENFNGSNFEEITQQRLKDINRIVRKQYFNQVKQLLSEKKSLFFISIFIVLYVFAFQFFSFEVFKKTSIVFFYAPALISIIFYFSHFIKSKKSAFLICGSSYVFFSFLVLNIVIQFTSVEDEGLITVSKNSYKIILYLVTIINGIFTSAGILVYNRISKDVKQIQAKLFS